MHFLTAPKILFGRPPKSPNRGAAIRAFWSRKREWLLAAVVFGVCLPCVRGVLRGVVDVGGFFVVAGLVVLGGFGVVLGGLRVVGGGVLVVFGGFL